MMAVEINQLYEGPPAADSRRLIRVQLAALSTPWTRRVMLFMGC